MNQVQQNSNTNCGGKVPQNALISINRVQYKHKCLHLFTVQLYNKTKLKKPSKNNPSTPTCRLKQNQYERKPGGNQNTAMGQQCCRKERSANFPVLLIKLVLIYSFFNKWHVMTSQPKGHSFFLNGSRR
ncbi:hypothetical protein ILYODFUR_009609 [Ilyodon furcidens]|uniref:Uncharacterized protein n=1 Tax=Ilyodon furcidens TaxID=33524 RepID=A0ABV0UGW3_9TELE